MAQWSDYTLADIESGTLAAEHVRRIRRRQAFGRLHLAVGRLTAAFSGLALAARRMEEQWPRFS